MIALDALFQQIPLLERYQFSDFEQHRLPGLTNTNIRLTNDEMDLVLRLPNPEVNGEVDRKAELHNHCIALEHGIALDILWSNHDGVTLSAWLPGSHQLSPKDLHQQSMLEYFVSRISSLHQSTPRFKGVVSIDERLSYFQSQKNVGSNLKQQEEVNGILSRYRSLHQFESQPVNSHNDLNLGNCLKVDDGSIWLIDWEYSARASAYWDLASLSNQMGWDKPQNERLIEIYCRYCSSAGDLNPELFECYKIMLTQLEQLWIQVHRKQPAFD